MNFENFKILLLLVLGSKKGKFFRVVIFKFLSQNNSQERKMTKIVFFIFKFLIFIFYFVKFETLSPKLHHLTLNLKSTLVNPIVKTHFYLLIKLSLVIIFIENYFCDKNSKMVLLENFSFKNLSRYHCYWFKNFQNSFRSFVIQKV